MEESGGLLLNYTGARSEGSDYHAHGEQDAKKDRMGVRCGCVCVCVCVFLMCVCVCVFVFLLCGFVVCVCVVCLFVCVYVHAYVFSCA